MGEKVMLWEQTPGQIEGEETPYIDLHLIDTDAPRGLVVVCPGGGYVMRAPHEADPIAQMINRQGMHAVVLHYRVAPYRYPYPLLDAQRTIRYVRAHAEEWNIDAEHIGILGFSAGGHLAATASTHYDEGNSESDDPIERFSCRPNASVLCYAVVSFQPFGHPGSSRNLLGDTPKTYEIAALSNELCVDANTPPAFLWHTAADTGVVPENSIRYAQALAANGVPYELHIFQDGPHGIGLGEGDAATATWGDLCGIWLRKHGF